MTEGKVNRSKLLRFVSILYRYTQIHMGRVLRGYGILPGQYPFILGVCHTPGINQDRLSCELAIDKGTTAKAVKSLEKAGFLERRADGRDRRSLLLFPTARGFDLERTLSECIRDWREILWTDFSEEEKERAFELTVRMAENARAHLSRCRKEDPGRQEPNGSDRSGMQP